MLRLKWCSLIRKEHPVKVSTRRLSPEQFAMLRPLLSSMAQERVEAAYNALVGGQTFGDAGRDFGFARQTVHVIVNQVWEIQKKREESREVEKELAISRLENNARELFLELRHDVASGQLGEYDKVSKWVGKALTSASLSFGIKDSDRLNKILEKAKT